MLGDLVIVVLVVFCKMGAMPDIKVQLMHEKTPSKEKSYELWIDVCLSHYVYKVTKPSDSKRQTFPKKRGFLNSNWI